MDVDPILPGKRPHVIHVIGSALPARTFAAPMVRWLRAHGFKADLWVGNQPPHPEAAAHMGVDFTSIDSELLGTPWAVAARLIHLRKALRTANPDIVHVHLTRSATLPLLAASLARIPKRIYHNHGLAFRSRTGLSRAAGYLIERLNIGLATRVLFPSPSTAKEAVAAGLIAPDRAQVPADGSDAGVDVEAFPRERLAPPARLDARRDLGLPADAFILVFIGRPVPHKGLRILLTAWTQTNARQSHGRLLVAGCTATEVQTLSGAPLPDDIVPLGFRPDLLPVYAAADAIALPSAYEGFPNALLEAAAAARPTLGADVPGTRDAIVHGETGFLLPFGDVRAWREGIDSMAGDGELRTRLGEAARARVEALFGRERVMRAVLGSY
jgi:glycosyltransferase involved in cell wall biosynthesis